MLPVSSEKIASFYEKFVVSESGCWEWKKTWPSNRYGVFRLFDRYIKASRASWIIHNGITPESRMHVCHSCDNPPCVNPSHLWLGTALDNSLDALKKGRLNPFPGQAARRLQQISVMNCKRGHALSKLKSGRRWCPTCKAALKRKLRRLAREQKLMGEVPVMS